MDGLDEYFLTRDRRGYEDHREREARMLLTMATMRFRANDLWLWNQDSAVPAGRLHFTIDVSSVDFWNTYLELKERKDWPD